MTNTDSITLRLLVAIFLSLFLLRCSSPTEVTDNPDNPGGSEVWAKLVDSDDNPVAGAHVAAYDTSDTSRTPVAEKSTNSNGVFGFDSTELEPGIYDFVGTYDDTSLVVVIKARAHDADSLGTFIMLPPGAISGIVQMVGSSAYDDVKCYIPGTSYQATPDESGGFTVSNVPPGSYSLVCFKPGYVRDKTEGINVVSGEDTEIQTTVLNPDTTGKPRPPRNARAFYETASGQVRITWDSSFSPDVYGYYVYKGKSPPYELVTHSPVEGLSYVYDGLEPGLTESELLERRFLVAAVDGDGNISDNASAAMQSSFSILIDSPYQILDKGDDIHCRITIQRPAGDYSVRISSRGPGSDTSWFSPALTDNTVDTLLPIGNASSWDSVLIRVDAPGAGIIDTAILVDIRPEPVAPHVSNTTISSITFSWDQPSDVEDFESYLIQIILDDSTRLDTLENKDILQYEYQTSQNRVIGFTLAVRDSEGLVSAWSDTVSASIINSPPRFSNRTGVFKDTITAGRPWSQTFSAEDPNDDRFSFELIPTLINPVAALILDEQTLSWTTSFDDVGSYAASLVVKDTLGAADTMRLFLDVVIRDTVVSLAVPTPSLRMSPTATALQDNIFVIGGRKKKPSVFFPWKSENKATGDVDVFAIERESWETEYAPMPQPRFGASSAVVNEVIYQIGGIDQEEEPLADVQILKTGTGKWESGPSLPYPVYDAAACSYNETIYLIGGVKVLPDGIHVQNDEIFSLSSGADSWVRSGALLRPRIGHCAAVVGNAILIAAGADESGLIGGCEWFNPDTKKSTIGSNLVTKRKNASLVVLGQTAYLMGGSDFSDATLASVEVLDPPTKLWGNARSLLEPRSSHAAAVVDDRVYLIGGTRDDYEKFGAPPTDVVEVYYP